MIFISAPKVQISDKLAQPKIKKSRRSLKAKGSKAFNLQFLIGLIRKCEPIYLDLNRDWVDGKEEYSFSNDMDINVDDYTIYFHVEYAEVGTTTNGSYYQPSEYNTISKHCEVSEISIWKDEKEIKIPKSLLDKINQELTKLLHN